MSYSNDTTLQNRRSNRSNGRNITTTTALPPAPQYSYIVTLPTKTHTLNESINADPSRNYSIVLSEIITTLDPATHKKILQQTTLSIEDLIKPKGKFRNGVPPRPQNPWVIYRKDLQAKLVAEQGAEIEFGARVGSISRMASEKWNNEPQEVKQVYEIIAEVAKRVHEQMFPNYKYKPRRKGNNTSFSRRSSSASDTSLEGFKRNFGDFKSNTSTFQIERPERRKSTELDTIEDTKTHQNNNTTDTSSSSGTSKKPYPSPPLTADPRGETPSAVMASSSSSSQNCLDQLSTRRDSLPASRAYTPSWSNSVDGPQQNIIPSWTLYDTTRISPANIFTDVTSQLSSINNEPTIYNNYTQFQQYPNRLLEISPSPSFMAVYDRSLIRLFGGP